MISKFALILLIFNNILIQSISNLHVESMNISNHLNKSKLLRFKCHHQRNVWFTFFSHWNHVMLTD